MSLKSALIFFLRVVVFTLKLLASKVAVKHLVVCLFVLGLVLFLGGDKVLLLGYIVEYKHLLYLIFCLLSNICTPVRARTKAKVCASEGVDSTICRVAIAFVVALYLVNAAVVNVKHLALGQILELSDLDIVLPHLCLDKRENLAIVCSLEVCHKLALILLEYSVALVVRKVVLGKTESLCYKLLVVLGSLVYHAGHDIDIKLNRLACKVSGGVVLGEGYVDCKSLALGNLIGLVDNNVGVGVGLDNALLVSTVVVEGGIFLLALVILDYKGVANLGAGKSINKLLAPNLFYIRVIKINDSGEVLAVFGRIKENSSVGDTDNIGIGYCSVAAICTSDTDSRVVGRVLVKKSQFKACNHLARADAECNRTVRKVATTIKVYLVALIVKSVAHIVKVYVVAGLYGLVLLVVLVGGVLGTIGIERLQNLVLKLELVGLVKRNLYVKALVILWRYVEES